MSTGLTIKWNVLNTFHALLIHLSLLKLKGQGTKNVSYIKSKISTLFLMLTPFDPNKMCIYIKWLKFVMLYKGTHEGQKVSSRLSGFLVTWKRMCLPACWLYYTTLHFLKLYFFTADLLIRLLLIINNKKLIQYNKY